MVWMQDQVYAWVGDMDELKARIATVEQNCQTIMNQ